MEQGSEYFPWIALTKVTIWWLRLKIISINTSLITNKLVFNAEWFLPHIQFNLNLEGIDYFKSHKHAFEVIIWTVKEKWFFCVPRTSSVINFHPFSVVELAEIHWHLRELKKKMILTYFKFLLILNHTMFDSCAASSSADSCTNSNVSLRKSWKLSFGIFSNFTVSNTSVDDEVTASKSL